MDQIALAIQNSVDGIGKIPADLTHPQPVCGSRDARDLHLARRQLDEEQHDEPMQPPAGPGFCGEETRSPQSAPNAGSETPSRSSSGYAPAPAGLYPVA